MLRRLSVSLLGVAGVLLAGCGSSAGTATTGVSTSLGAKSLPSISLPAYVPGPLTGESTPRALALRRPLAVILENYAPDSRPQAGLGSASTVIETLAESGITRFMAIYLEHDAKTVGPVRSARIYFDHWASGFHAILTHVGGNDDAVARLWHLPKVFNIDENRWERSLYDTGTHLFWRSQARQAPHNMYTSTLKLRAWAEQHHENWAYTQASFPHKQPVPMRSRGKSGTLTITFSNPLAPADNPDYDVKYVYERGQNDYARFMGGSPHIDVNTGHPIRPANVIVMHTAAATADLAAGPTPQSIVIPVLGRGPATVFQDGKAVPATWVQRDENAPLRFVSRTGKPIALNPGQTWIEVLPSGSTSVWSVR